MLNFRQFDKTAKHLALWPWIHKKHKVWDGMMMMRITRNDSSISRLAVRNYTIVCKKVALLINTQWNWQKKFSHLEFWWSHLLWHILYKETGGTGQTKYIQSWFLHFQWPWFSFGYGKSLKKSGLFQTHVLFFKEARMTHFLIQCGVRVWLTVNVNALLKQQAIFSNSSTAVMSSP